MKTLAPAALAAVLVAAFGGAALAAGRTTLVTVTVPVGATLTINGRPTHQMTGVRQFVTPELPVGPKYRYQFEATFTWFGEEVTKRKLVELTAGTTVSVDMMQGETVVKPPPREEEEEQPAEPQKPEPKPDPKPPEKEPEPPKRDEKPKPQVPDTRPDPPSPSRNKPRPEPEKPRPNEPSVEPPRPLAPKPREVTIKTKK
jgi:uncharacterized protein (TIGR03000 family)